MVLPLEIVALEPGEEGQRRWEWRYATDWRIDRAVLVDTEAPRTFAFEPEGAQCVASGMRCGRVVLDAVGKLSLNDRDGNRVGWAKRKR